MSETTMERVEVAMSVLPDAGIWSLVYMIACAEADATDEEILAVCNRDNPSGTSGGWSQVAREDPETPNHNPVPCSDHPGRMHFLVNC